MKKWYLKVRKGNNELEFELYSNKELKMIDIIKDIIEELEIIECKIIGEELL